MEGFFAIKCRNCGGPMYSHQQTRSFDCAYCGASTPWAEGGPEPAPAMGIRHQPLQVVDGLLKLTHVSQLEPAQDSDWSYYKPYWRNMSLLERLLWEDPATADEFQNAEHVSVPLPVLRGGLRGQIHPKRVRVPLVRQQDRGCGPAQTRDVQQTPFHGHGGGTHP